MTSYTFSAVLFDSYGEVVDTIECQTPLEMFVAAADRIEAKEAVEFGLVINRTSRTGWAEAEIEIMPEGEVYVDLYDNGATVARSIESEVLNAANKTAGQKAVQVLARARELTIRYNS